MTVYFKPDMHRHCLLILTSSSHILLLGSNPEQEGLEFAGAGTQVIYVTTSLRRGDVSQKTQVLDNGRRPTLAIPNPRPRH